MGLSITQWFAGRFPLYATIDLQLAFQLKQSGHSFSEAKELALFENKYPLYFMFNKDSSPELILKLQKSLDKVKSIGIYKDIQSKWLK